MARDFPLELVILAGEQTSVVPLPRAGEVSLGRAEDNVVRIDDASVSRHHAVLRVGPPLVIEDLGAANGTCVRETRTGHDPSQTQGIRRLVRQRAELAVGECVLLGSVCAVVRHGSEMGSSADGLLQEAALGSGLRAEPRDPALRAVYAEAERVARATISVLVLGETGVGKEVLARAIHARSPRAQGPFVSINCAALNETLLEGELFGHERGAFTGATQARPGLFEAANGGTLFLDEVGDASLATQAKLLRVVEERAVLRVGARQPRPVDVRLVAATNRRLEADVESGRFRQDLFFRLGAVTLTIPPLRERPLDIEPLVRAFVAAACRQLERAPARIAPEALRCLQAYSWPGNVRELRNVIERAVVLAGEPTLEPEHLPLAVRRALAGPGVTPPPQLDPHSAAIEPGSRAPSADTAELDAASFRAEVKARERERILAALERAGGNQTKAAGLLGVSRRTLVSRLQEFGLTRQRKPRGSS